MTSTVLHLFFLAIAFITFTPTIIHAQSTTPNTSTSPSNTTTNTTSTPSSSQPPSSTPSASTPSVPATTPPPNGPGVSPTTPAPLGNAQVPAVNRSYLMVGCGATLGVFSIIVIVGIVLVCNRKSNDVLLSPKLGLTLEEVTTANA
eukprot:PhF_6_TR18840/c0_g1_i1/m.27410